MMEGIVALHGASLLASPFTPAEADARFATEAFLGSHLDEIISVHQSRPPMSKFGATAVTAVAWGLQNAQLDLSGRSADRCGVAICSRSGPLSNARSYLAEVLHSPDGRSSPMAFPKTTANIALGDVARKFQLKGPSAMLFGESALQFAFDQIEAGRAELMICLYLELQHPSLALGIDAPTNGCAAAVIAGRGAEGSRRDPIRLGLLDPGSSRIGYPVQFKASEAGRLLARLSNAFEVDEFGEESPVAEFRLAALVLGRDNLLDGRAAGSEAALGWAEASLAPFLAIHAGSHEHI